MCSLRLDLYYVSNHKFTMISATFESEGQPQIASYSSKSTDPSQYHPQLRMYETTALHSLGTLDAPAAQP